MSLGEVPIQIDNNHTVNALIKVVYVQYLKVNKKKLKVVIKKTLLGRAHLRYDLSCGRVGGGKLLS